ncbi:MAG: sugar phosphate isomerase/epimerase [Bacteroidales bacterium]|nr:sugar phosphate isomerase/epimerase [Bacteroidales bacterium]
MLKRLFTLQLVSRFVLRFALSLPLTLSLSLSLGSCCREEVKLSIFAAHIRTIATQEGIPFSEAAARVKALGYTGADVPVTFPEEDIATLDSLGFRHACAIVHFDFHADEQAGRQEAALDFVTRHGYSTLLVVPGLLPADYGEDDYRLFVGRFKSFVDRALRVGVTVVIEDFDNPRSPTFNTGRIDRMLSEIPELKLNFDTGNFVFAGEDVMAALDHFRGKIGHVHLKDRLAVSDRRSPAIGKGIVPFPDFIRGLLDSGYDGWLTVEHFGSAHMLEDAGFSAQTVMEILK